jgi:type II secretory pathway pseudopilin PulG
MRVKLLCSSDGFTYIMALFAIVVMGIMLSAAAQNWKTIMLREREKELLFRGMQYKDAITRWYKSSPLGPGQAVAFPLNDLKDLLKDPRTTGSSTIRYIRELYKDPITGEDWVPIRGGATGGIIGVASSSELMPIKKSDFPEGLESFEGKKKYSDWQFVYQQNTTTPTTSTSTITLPTSTDSTTSN